MRSTTIHPDTSEFRPDPDGWLFDPRIRQLLLATGRKVTPRTEALAAVRILGKKMHATMERWADKHGLSEGRFQILVRLQHRQDGRCTMGDLAEMLEVSPRTVTGLVDNLERDGLVRRVDDPNDRRSVYAEMTEKGRDRVKALWRDATLGQEALTRGFTDTELVQFRHLCLRMIEAMSAEEATTHATS
jgi:DNA-binding MarR family transcriptional regulator